MPGPDKRFLIGSPVADSWKVTNEGRLALPPCGWLAFLVMEPTHSRLGWDSANLEFELTDFNFVPLYARMEKPSVHLSGGIRIDSIAMMLDEPIPSMNAAAPYTLEAKTDHPVAIHVAQFYYLPSQSL